MFAKALRDHPQQQQQQAKPLFPSSSRLNIAAASISSQSVSTKRKFDVTESATSSLGALHEAVYFDEHDFDDDDILELGDGADLLEPASATKPTRPVANASKIKSPTSPPPLPAPVASARDAAPPPSSVPLPWSSSPPTHYLPPSKRRTLPWLQQDGPPAAVPPNTDARQSHDAIRRQRTSKTQDVKQDTKPDVQVKANRKPQSKPAEIPPPAKKPFYPWNTTMSPVKADQRELRKQQKQLRTSAPKDQVRKPRDKVPQMFLSDEQRHVLDVIVSEGASVFFTGSAGTGKSVLMREIIRHLRDKFKREPDRVAVTASTGLAACNIEGVTLHSFAGVGLGKEGATELVKKVKRNQKARTRWLRTKVLVIDEVSMVDGDFFDKLEELARKIRSNGRPFGGIQLVVTGDFFQLPPVPEGSHREAKFAFAANTWNTSIQHTILLTHIFRQKDPKFASMLNEMRLGRLTPESIEAFKALSRPLNFHDSLDATELFPTRTEVENANAQRMNRLSGEVMVFQAIDSGAIKDVQTRDRLLANCMAPPTIHLKKGAQVMLIKNMDDTLVNGSLGKVVAFMDDGTFDYYNKHEEEFQGDSGDEAFLKLKKHRGMGLDPKNGGISTARKWPVVSFIQPDGTERHLLCQPEVWKIELPNGEVQAQRQQVPLILAWALSIHKAQGQTLQRVKVDLGRVFEKGQAYVALSRATSQSGLQVSRFDPRKVMVHPKVTEFYANLSDIKQVKNAIAAVDQQQPPMAGEDEAEDFGDEDWEAFREMNR